MPNHRHTLRTLIDRDVAHQNGLDYEVFSHIAEVVIKLPRDKRPSMTSLARLFNRNVRTFQSWLERYEEERE